MVIASCGKCPRKWTSLTQCHCSVCHRQFGGIAGFDYHRRDVKGKGTCVDPSTLVFKDADGVRRPRLFLHSDDVWRQVPETGQVRGSNLAVWRAEQRLRQEQDDQA